MSGEICDVYDQQDAAEHAARVQFEAACRHAAGQRQFMCQAELCQALHDLDAALTAIRAERDAAFAAMREGE